MTDTQRLADLLVKVQNPATETIDLTQHFMYCFVNLMGRSGFQSANTPDVMALHQKIVTAIVQNPNWNYAHTTGQVMAGACLYTKTDRCIEQTIAAFDVFLQALPARYQADFLDKNYDRLVQIGVNELPWVQARTLHKVVGNTPYTKPRKI